MTTREFIDNFKETHGRFPSQVETSKQLKISPNAAITAFSDYLKEHSHKKGTVKAEKHRKDLTVGILKGFLILLSAMAFTLSVYFTGLWFSDKFHIVISGMISLTMVLFMVISPQVLRYVNNPFVKAIVIVSFIIALLFSMGSTVAGQFNATTVIRESMKDVQSIYTIYETREAELIDLINESKEDKLIHSEALINLSATEEKRLDNWQQVATERKYIDQFNSRIDDFNAELREVRSKMNVELSTGIVEKRRDFYSFIAGLMNTEDISLVEFIISAMPSVFIDLIAALCLNLALFLKEKI